MRNLKILGAVPLILLLTSCVGQEPDNIAYITAMGIDRSENGYNYTIQFANPTKISGGGAEEGGSGGEIVENITVEAPTIYSAINNANTIVSKDMSLSHAKIFVVSEEVAREGLNGINDVISRNNDIRPDVYLAVAENSEEYLEEVKPVIELNPIKYYQLTYKNKSGSSVPQNKAVDFCEACFSGNIDCVLPLAGVAQTEEEQSDSQSSEETESGSINESHQYMGVNEQGFENKTGDYLAGQAGKKIKNKSEAIGMAVFINDKYISKFGNTETELYNILMNKFHEDNIVFYSESNPEKPITIKLEEKIAPVYKIDMDRKTVDISLKLEGELLSASSNHRSDNSIVETNESTSEMISEAAEKFIENIYHDLGADSLGIKGRVKKKFATLDEYDRYCESFNPAEWSFHVHTNMKLKRTGMTYYY